MYYECIATLIVAVLFGLIIAIFATQNTAGVTLHFFNYTVPNVPTYIVVIGALLVGLLIAWVISLINDISTGFRIRGKENRIKDYKKENVELVKKLHQLELENTRLKAETDTPADDMSL